MRYALRWAAAIGVLAWYDVRCDRNDTTGDTFSECTRLVFHTDHPAGRLVFALALGAGSGWYAHHILSGPCSSTT